MIIHLLHQACGYEEWKKNLWIQFRCGLCGDNENDALPRAHELGGIYGKGIVVKTYTQGSIIEVLVRLSGNHRGYFYFQLCNTDDEPESEECFSRHRLRTTSGAEVYQLPTSSPGDFRVSLKLPKHLTCKLCVLQWTYVAANNMGLCEDYEERLGCGPQEHWRSCSDISIESLKFQDDNSIY